MRYALIALSILFGSATTASAQVSIGISVPGVSIGINLPVYPELVPVPGYPVYYAPRVNSNFFFYDGLYWVYQDDNWYVSSWYNGPWEFVSPDYVPLFVLRVPVRYYVNPPVYFHGWMSEAPPRWGDHWGHRWAQHRNGWDRWDRRAVYAPAPLPVYQRHYSGNRYPRAEHQRVIRNEHYRYQPRDAVVRQHDQERATPRVQAPAQSIPQGRPDIPRAQRPQRDREDMRRPVTTQASPQQQGPAVQEQRQQPRQEADRRAQAPAQSAPQGRPDVSRAQRQRDREDMQRPVTTQAVPQRGPAVQEQRQPPRQETGPRAQQAPRAQGQERGAQGRGDTPQPRGNAERRQGQERGQERGQQERGNDRGYGRG